MLIAKKVDEAICNKLINCLDIVRTSMKKAGVPFQLSLFFSKYIDSEVRNGQIETIECSSEFDISIKVFKGNKIGIASSNSTNPDSIKNTVEKALEIAEYATDDPFSAPVDPQFLPTKLVDFNNYSMPPIDIAAASAVALELEQTALNYNKNITNSEGSNLQYSDHHSLFALNDFSAITTSSSCYAGVSVIAQHKQEMQSGNCWSHSMNNINDIDIKTIGEKAATNAINSLQPLPIKTGKYPVLFLPDVATSLISAFLNAINGNRIYKKTSFLLDSIGEQVFPSWFNMLESPFLSQAWGSSNFDYDGATRTEKLIVEQGKIQTFLYSCYSAKKLNTTTTGNAGGVTNIELSHSDLSKEELIANLGTGIIVTQLMGDASSLITGNYSRGAKGFFVDKGKIQHPVEEMTLSSNLKDMMKNVRAIGKDIDNRHKYLTGSWLIDNILVAN